MNFDIVLFTGQDMFINKELSKKSLKLCHLFYKVYTISLLRFICSGRDILCNFADDVTLETDTVLKKFKQHLLKSSQNSSFVSNSNLLTFSKMSGIYF